MNTNHFTSQRGRPRLRIVASTAGAALTLILLARSAARSQQPLFTAPAGVSQAGNYATCKFY
jgi:hypothetical protein